MEIVRLSILVLCPPFSISSQEKESFGPTCYARPKQYSSITLPAWQSRQAPRLHLIHASKDVLFSPVLPTLSLVLGLPSSSFFPPYAFLDRFRQGDKYAGLDPDICLSIYLLVYLSMYLPWCLVCLFYRLETAYIDEISYIYLFLFFWV